MSYGSYGSYGVPKKSYSYSMSAHTHVYTSGNVKASKTSKNMKVPGADSNKLAKNSAEMFIARNFARSVHKIITDISGEDLPIDFQFDAGGGGDRNGLMPARYVDKCGQVNTGPSELITSLLTAKDEYQINKALKKDFTKVVEKLAPSDSGGGSGSGFQVYFKGVEVLSIGAGGGGGYEQVDKEKESSQSRSKSRKHEEESNWILGRGGGGGSQIIINLPEITSKSYNSRNDNTFRSKTGKKRKLINADQLINVGGGQGLEDGELKFSFDEENHPHAFIKQLRNLRKILSEADINDVAVLGGGGGGGAGCGPDGKKTEGGGYGFGFQIGTPRAIERAKRVASGTGNGCSDVSYLSEQEQNEPWARNQQKYTKKYASC